MYKHALVSVLHLTVLVLLLWTSLNGSSSSQVQAGGSACDVKRAVERLPQLQAEAPANEVRLFWWHRFRGARRAAKRAGVTLCDKGLRCVSDSRPTAFPAAHGVVVWIGARPDRQCFPPKLEGQVLAITFVFISGTLLVAPPYRRAADVGPSATLTLSPSTRIRTDIPWTRPLPMSPFTRPFFFRRGWLNIRNHRRLDQESNEGHPHILDEAWVLSVCAPVPFFGYEACQDPKP